MREGNDFGNGILSLQMAWVILAGLCCVVQPVLAAEAVVTDACAKCRTSIGDIPWDPESILSDNKVVYGTDDRIDVYQETNASRKTWAESVCALVDTSDLTNNGNGTYGLRTYAYTQSGYSPCSDEPFRTQPTAAWCTGFIVGDDVVATAGHCIESGDMPYVRFVFGFEMQNATTPVLTFDADQIYMGVEIIARQLVGEYDYAIVRVDRPITVGEPLPLRTSGTVAVGTRVGVIGHPSGLPMKIAFGSATQVRSNTETGYFTANLDTYGGNSGSPVFNATDGTVEGILVRGNQDFVINVNCFRSNVLPDNTMYSEDVSKSTTFASYVNQAPANDDCQDAQSIAAGQTKTGNTRNATGTDITSCGVNDYTDVWYSFIPAAGKYYKISLCESDFDTTLAVFGGGCSSLTELECNDDLGAKSIRSIWFDV